MAEHWVKLADVKPHQTTPMVRQFMQAKVECAGLAAVLSAWAISTSCSSRTPWRPRRSWPHPDLPRWRGQGSAHSHVRRAGARVDGYVAKVHQGGRTVTICDQVEDPKDAKGIVKREVIAHRSPRAPSWSRTCSTPPPTTTSAHCWCAGRRRRPRLRGCHHGRGARAAQCRGRPRPVHGDRRTGAHGAGGVAGAACDDTDPVLAQVRRRLSRAGDHPTP
jgi:hypothetical protein